MPLGSRRVEHRGSYLNGSAVLSRTGNDRCFDKHSMRRPKQRSMPFEIRQPLPFATHILHCMVTWRPPSLPATRACDGGVEGNGCKQRAIHNYESRPLRYGHLSTRSGRAQNELMTRTIASRLNILAVS